MLFWKKCSSHLACLRKSALLSLLIWKKCFSLLLFWKKVLSHLTRKEMNTCRHCGGGRHSSDRCSPEKLKVLIRICSSKKKVLISTCSSEEKCSNQCSPELLNWNNSAHLCCSSEKKCSSEEQCSSKLAHLKKSAQLCYSTNKSANRLAQLCSTKKRVFVTTVAGGRNSGDRCYLKIKGPHLLLTCSLPSLLTWKKLPISSCSTEG